MNKNNKKLIVGLCILVGLVIIPGVVVMILKPTYQIMINNKISTEAKAFAEKYHADGPYTLGNVEDCTKDSPSGYSGLTSSVSCKVTNAQLFYLPVSVHGQSLSIPYETDELGRKYQGVYYDPAPTRLYLNLSDNSIYDGRVDSHQSTGMHILNTSYIYRKSLEPQNEGIAGLWSLTKTENSGTGNNADSLIHNIEKSLSADESIAQGIAAPSQFLTKNKAPLVVYYSLRFCHSMDIVLLDTSCLLPN